MPRLVRTVMPAILPVVLALALVAMGPGASIGVSGGAVALAAVSWPPSTGLVVGEVVTGGASASDEFVELYNAGLSSIDLAGLEVVYVTSTGGTVTRKATWASTTMLEPGRHLLLANSAGMHAPIGDAVYTGGLAATGGAIAVRPIGGDAIDAVGWGDATNAFVEGAVAPAPPAGTSLERLPGGAAGNSIDTNDNASDWLLDPAPVAQNLAAPAVPAAGASATPSPTSTPTATPSPTSAPTATPTLVPTPSPSATPAPTATPTLVPTPSPSATPAPTATPTLVPTPSPSATPAPTATPTPSPTVTPTTAPSPSASPTPGIELIDIALARSSATDTRVRVRGVVTVEPGRIVDDRTLAIQDGTAGILIRLDGGRKDLVVARGSDVVVEGRLTSRYGTLEIRLDDGDPLDILGSTALPTARPIQLTALGEATEGLLVHASGTLTDIDVAKSGTTTIVIEDASGRGRIVAFAGAGALPDGLRRGVSLAVEGIAGQRASAKGRLDGYRIWVRDGGDLRIVVPAPSPATSASPSRAPEGSPSPSIMTIAAARSRTGQKVTVEGTITTQGGLFDADGRRVTIQDGTAGILLRLAAREKAPPVGSRIRVAGTIGTYYGAPQLAATGPAERFGSAPIAPPTITKAPGAAVEWQLIRVKGTIVDVKRTGQAWRAELAMAGGIRVAIVGLSRARISSDRIREGAQGAIVGIVRRAYPTATDRRFAVLPRGRGDLDLTTVAATPSTGTSGSDHTDAGAGSSGGDGTASAAGAASALSDTAAPTLDMIELSANVGRLVRVGGLVTRVVAPDADEAGPTVEIEDASGAAALRLPFEATTMAMSLATGDLVEARGIVEVDVDDQVIVSVDDAADFVLAGQVASAGGSHGSTASPGSEADAGSLSGAGGGSGVQEPVGGLDAGDAAMTPLMGATGAGVILGGILGTGAAAAHWRRRRAGRQASKEATERLVDLLSGPREGHMGTQGGGVSRESFDS